MCYLSVKASGILYVVYDVNYTTVEPKVARFPLQAGDLFSVKFTAKASYTGSATFEISGTNASDNFADNSVNNLDTGVSASYSNPISVSIHAPQGYTVTFVDYNGTPIKTQDVLAGGAATAPVNPTRTGYTFSGWDKTFANITVATTVTAQYTIFGQLTGFDIPGSVVVGNIPVGSSDTIYAPTIFVNIPATTTAITAANLLKAAAETIVLYSSIAFGSADVITSSVVLVNGYVDWDAGSPVAKSAYLTLDIPLIG